MINKSISMDEKLWDKVKTFSEIHHKSMSAMIREALTKYLKEKTKNDLAYKMKTLTPFMEAEEQTEIENELLKTKKEDLELAEIIEL